MRVNFDPEADIIYLQFRNGKVEDMEDVDEDAWVEYGEKGEIIGLEIHRAKEWVKNFLLELGKKCDYMAEDAAKECMKKFFAKLGGEHSFARKPQNIGPSNVTEKSAIKVGGPDSLSTKMLAPQVESTRGLR